MKAAYVAALLGTATAGMVEAGSLTVFQSNFDSATKPAEFSGAGALEAVGGYAGATANAFSGSFLVDRDASIPQQQAATLTLTGLPEHTSVSLAFLLATIDTWDAPPGTYGPDYFNVTLDGTPIFREVFDNWNWGIGQTYGPTMFRADVFGIGYADAAYNLGLDSSLQNISHSGSTLTLSFFASGSGWQGGSDEAWGIDNLTVTLNGIPDGGASATLGLGSLLAMAALRRYSKRA